MVGCRRATGEGEIGGLGHAGAAEHCTRLVVGSDREEVDRGDACFLSLQAQQSNEDPDKMVSERGGDIARMGNKEEEVK